VSATLLFVHSPLVGPSTWAATAQVLKTRGFRCQLPDLRHVFTVNPPYYPKLAAAAAEAVAGSDPVVLVGHSAAGSLLPAIADEIAGRTRGAIFIDALLPHPARSWFDTAPPALRRQLQGMADGGLLPPWSDWFPPGAIEKLLPDPALRRAFVEEIPRVPVSYFAEPAPATRSWDVVPCALVRFSAAYDDAADEAEHLGWWVVRRDWDHLRMLTAASAVADCIAEVTSAMQADAC
jgi:pimeloyl-ACP methyl ester carboxylesterase